MNDLKPQPAEFLERQATRVRVFTPSGIVEGEYHHPPGVRLSDSLRNAATGERYMLLTEVTLRSIDGSAISADIATAPFILINTQHASAILPLEEE
ncbi:MAG TPA: hypothetical protein VIH21_07285 [Dehalococcoidia bacterium]|jgi:hypothetical protein